MGFFLCLLEKESYSMMNEHCLLAQAALDIKSIAFSKLTNACPSCSYAIKLMKGNITPDKIT